MGDKSAIEWTDATWNPIVGTKGRWHCTKVSHGCRGCYAERMNRRFGGPAYQKGADQLRLNVKTLGQPLRWRRPRLVFPCSMTDMFHEPTAGTPGDVPPSGWTSHWAAAMFGVMAATPRHTYQVVTKRPERMRELLVDCLPRGAELETIAGMAEDYLFGKRTGTLPRGASWPLPNVWLGVSVEDQLWADRRIPLLLQCPAAVRWISAEPLLGPLDLRHMDVDRTSAWCQIDALTGQHTDMGRPCQDVPKLDWVVCGGESGPYARPMKEEWVQSLRDQCLQAGTAFLFKQWGQYVPVSQADGRAQGGVLIQQERSSDGAKWFFFRGNKKDNGRQLDGRIWHQMPNREG